jgi:hypothetical protein
MKHEGWFTCLKQRRSLPYREPVEQSPCFSIYFSKIYFNIIPHLRQSSLSIRFTHQNAVCISLRPHTCHTPHPSPNSEFHHPNNVWWGDTWLNWFLPRRNGTSSGWGWRRPPPDVEGRCQHIGQAVADSRQGGLLVWMTRKGLMTAPRHELTRQEMLHRDFDLDRSFGKLE